MIGNKKLKLENLNRINDSNTGALSIKIWHTIDMRSNEYASIIGEKSVLNIPKMPDSSPTDHDNRIKHNLDP